MKASTGLLSLNWFEHINAALVTLAFFRLLSFPLFSYSSITCIPFVIAHWRVAPRYNWLIHSPKGRVQDWCSFLDTRLWLQAPTTPSPNAHTHTGLLHNHHNFTIIVIWISAWIHGWNKGKEGHMKGGFVVQDNEVVCILWSLSNLYLR